MKPLALAAGALAWLALCSLPPAARAEAFVVEVTTSIAVSDADDEAQLTRARVVGERLYVRLLIADRDGEKTFNDPAEPKDEDALGSASPTIER